MNHHQLVRTLYRIKRFYKKPITKLANELIEKSLHTINKEGVCMTCIEEENQECDVCVLVHL
jgi:hypothetical protein